jgi:hypothetical protein
LTTTLLIDLSDHYYNLLRGGSRETYHASYPSFFNHYFSVWGFRGQPEVLLRWPECERRRSMLLRAIEHATQILAAEKLPMHAIDSLLMVGQGTANGHAFIDGDRAIAWFALECFEHPFEARVFVMHELVHAIHYYLNPESYFTTPAEHRRVSRQLITEGIATYITQRLYRLSDADALWGGSLDGEAYAVWLQECTTREHEIAALLLETFDGSDPEVMLFYAADPSDVLRYRAGYYVGLELIRRFVDESALTPAELLQLPMAALEQYCRRALQTYGSNISQSSSALAPAADADGAINNKRS